MIDPRVPVLGIQISSLSRMILGKIHLLKVVVRNGTVKVNVGRSIRVQLQRRRCMCHDIVPFLLDGR